MLVTEFARTTQAFAVESVDEIVQLEWSQVLAAENTAAGSIVSSIARLDGNVDHSRLVQVLDVETVLRDANPTAEEAPLAVGDPISIRKGQVVLVADDSALARALIEQSLTALSLPYVTVKTGEEAWERLQAMAQAAEANGQNISDSIALVLTDLEMPVMDGYTLTRNIKQSPRFQKLPVLIHSSLSGPANGSRAAEVGADGYIAKFAAAELASEIRKILKS
jgi:two-component system chemotaxis response regulator CheV